MKPARTHSRAVLCSLSHAGYWHENADRNPPPPGAAPVVDVPEVSVMMVPCETLVPAEAEQADPEALAVLQLKMRLVAVQVVETVLGVTVNSAHVVVAPA